MLGIRLQTRLNVQPIVIFEPGDALESDTVGNLLHIYHPHGGGG